MLQVRIQRFVSFWRLTVGFPQVMERLFEGGNELLASDLEVFGGLDVDRVGAGVAAELGVEMHLIEKVIEKGFDGSTVTVDGVVESVVGGDRCTEREVGQIAAIAVVVEVRVVAADCLVVDATVFVKLVESRLQSGRRGGGFAAAALAGRELTVSHTEITVPTEGSAPSGHRTVRLQLACERV